MAEPIHDGGALTTEPAITIGAVTAVIGAIISLLVALGLDISNEVQNALLGLIAVGAPLVSAILTRARVYSPAYVDDLLE